MSAISVIGLGKMGLPFAVQCATKGHKVFGCDVSAETVSLVNKGLEPFPGEFGLKDRLTMVRKSGALEATTNTVASVKMSKFVVVLVPVYVDSQGVPSFDWIDAATESIGAGLQVGTLVSYETTLPIGTTRERFAAKLSEISGLQAGKDFYVAFSPERVYSGQVFRNLSQYPKLVGGINRESEEVAANFYESVLDFDERLDLPKPNGVWKLGSSEASEFAKLAETTYRDVNIGLANQFAKFADTLNINVYKVIEGCNSQPFSHIHQPGIAVGGHCIPIYPQMYLWNDPTATVVKAAREANKSMPGYGVDLLEAELGSLADQTVAVLGISYRGDVKEHAFSGVFDVVRELQKRGASVRVHDPMYSDEEIATFGFEPYTLGEKIDGVILQANHKAYSKLDGSHFPGAKMLIDGRGVYREIPSEIEGLKVIQIGRSSHTS